MVLELFWGGFGVVLGWFWCCFVLVLVLFWGGFGVVLGWFGVVFVSLLRRFCIGFTSFVYRFLYRFYTVFI